MEQSVATVGNTRSWAGVGAAMAAAVVAAVYMAEDASRFETFGNVGSRSALAHAQAAEDVSPGPDRTRTEKLFRLDGRVALVTGASRGIGFELAAGLADLGATVVLGGTNPATLADARAALLQRNPHAHVSTIAFDVGEPHACCAAVAEIVRDHGRIDVLVNNAGINKRATLDELDIADVQRVLDCNLLGPAVLARECAVHMRQRQWGRIVNVGSIMSTVGRAGLGAYVASKHALNGLTKVLSAELGADGITVNCLAPGYISTDLTSTVQADAAFDFAVRDRNPEGRWGTAADLVGPVLMLATDAGAYVNGAILVVDGGFTETFHIGGARHAPAAAR